MVVEAHRILRASPEHVFAFVAHPEHLPRYGAPLWLAADLEDRRGGEPLVALRGYFAGLPVEAVIRSASRAPHSIDIAQVRGTLRGFSQRFTIESDDEGTLLSCRVEADPGIPMLSDEAAKHFLTQYVERMLDRLRLAAERRAPSRRPARPSAKEPAEAAAETDAVEALAEDAATASEPVEQDHASAETAATGAIAVPAVPPEQAAGTPPAHRPWPPRRPRPPRSRRVADTAAAAPPPARETGPAARGAAPPGHTGTSEAASTGQGRRRRRRRRRGRGGVGPGAAGGAAGGAPNAGPSGNP